MWKTSRLFPGALVLCLLAGCADQRKMSSEETQPAESLQRAGGKLKKDAIASNEFMISVTGIDFSGVPIGDAELAPAAQLPYLRTIVLRGTKVTDAGLAVFKDCQYLETVDLSNSPISGTGLHYLRASSIKDFNLSHSKFGDGGIADLVKIGYHLLRLNLAATEITDDGLEQLAGLRTLEVIDLSRTRISGAGLRYLPTGLKQLNLAGAPITNASLVCLDRFPLLESLNLSGTNITDDAIPNIQAMIEAQNLKAGRRKFKYLDLRKTSVGDKVVAILQQAAPGLVVQR
jgi:uncharacterized protein YjbI with pentapeptide repeats